MSDKFGVDKSWGLRRKVFQERRKERKKSQNNKITIKPGTHLKLRTIKIHCTTNWQRPFFQKMCRLFCEFYIILFVDYIYVHDLNTPLTIQHT